MIIPLRCVGIDVSKHFLDIFDEAIGASERIANATQAITQLVARWRCDALVVFEATGVYDLELREALRQAGYYKDWRTRFGDRAWDMLERHTGRLI